MRRTSDVTIFISDCWLTAGWVKVKCKDRGGLTGLTGPSLSCWQVLARTVKKSGGMNSKIRNPPGMI